MRQSRRPAWLSEHVHAFAWLAAAIVVMALYIWIHAELRCDYIKEIRPQVRNEVKLYALRHHAVTGVLELRVDDEPYRFDPDDPGPLGIGNLPEARGGVLARAEAAIQHYNSTLHDYIEGLTAAFYPWEDNIHYMLVPQPALDPKAKSNSAAGVSRVFRVTVESFAGVRHSYPNEQTLDAIVDMVRGADLVELQAGKQPKVMPRAEGLRAAKAAAKRISWKRDELRQEVSGLFEMPATACPIPADAKGCGCPKTKHSGSAPEETRFHRELRTVVEGNIGFFWTMGKFLWYEIMMLAVLGVVTHKLVVFATEYASGRDQDQRDASARDSTGPLIWQPRESVRTLMQLVAAPIFSLVIIWILTLTNIVSVKPLIADTWSNGIVPIAFLLGLFPSLGYQVLHGLAEGVFSRRLVDEKRPTGNPQRILEAPDAPDGTAASFEQLRQRVRHHAMAVFER